MFGFALLAMSQGAYALRDGWVLAGLAIFVAVAFLGEGVLWPAERRLQTALAAAGPGAAGTDLAGAEPDVVVLARAATAATVLLLLGVVVMIAQP